MNANSTIHSLSWDAGMASENYFAHLTGCQKERRGRVGREGIKREAGVRVDEGEMRDEQRGGKDRAIQKQKEKTVGDL